MKALIVDDDARVCNALRSALKFAGHEPVVARDGRQALEAITESVRESAPVDVLIADWKMPGMTGVELIREARKQRPGMPAILITGYGDETVKGQAGEIRSCAYLEKPFRAESLLAKIEDEIFWDLVRRQQSA